MSFTTISHGYITPNGNVVMNDGTYGVVTPNRNVVITDQLPINPSPINVILPSQPKPYNRLLDQLKEANTKAQENPKPYSRLLEQLKKCKK